MPAFMALLTGLSLGAGLILSGMSDPSKVIGIFDLAGKWNLSRAFVLGGAILVGAVTFRIVPSEKRRY